MSKRILITGAAGFIGSFLSEALVSSQYFIVGVDNFFRGKIENLVNVKNKSNFILKEMDLSLEKNITELHKIIQDNEINTVIHLAAINGTQYFYDQPYFVFDQNISITKNLLSAIENTEVDYIIYSSSSEVYGDPMVIPTSESDPVLLKAHADRDSYAASKAAGDFYIRLFSQKNEISSLVLRIFNLYGNRMVGTKYGQVIPEFIHRMLFEDQFTIIGDGTNTRSFCYIDDAIGIIKSLIEKNVTGFVNVGNNQEITILELASLIHRLKGRDFSPIFLPKRPFDHQRRCPDITKLRALIPSLEFTQLSDGITKLFDNV